MLLDGQKQDMSCSDVFHVMDVALFVAGFAAISPMMIHQIKGMTLVIMMKKDEFIDLKIYKIWGEQIKTFHVDLCPDVFHDHVLKMFAWILDEVILRTWCRRWCQTLSLDNTGHQATRKRKHDQKGHKPGSSRPRRGVKTHLEECTTRYLGFKCFLFSVYRVYPEVKDGRGTLDLVCAFAVLFGVLEAWKCFADSWSSLVVFSLKRTCFGRFSGSCAFGEFVKEFHREDFANLLVWLKLGQ